MSTDPYTRWTALEVRRPADVPAATPLAWQVEKHGTHADRMANLHLPQDFPHPVERGTAADALAVIALRESIRRDMEHGRAVSVRQAVELGATWREVAEALDVSPDQARELLRNWAEIQHRLHEGDVAAGRSVVLGLDADARAAVLALTELGDDETAAATAGKGRTA